MKSEMTNEQVADAIEKRVAEASPNWDFAPTLRDAAERLRTFTLLSKAHQRLANDSVEYESNILKKLKVAEDALEKIRANANQHELDADDTGAVFDTADNALAAIREEGESEVRHA